LDNQSKSIYSRKGEELAYLLGIGNKKNPYTAGREKRWPTKT